MEFDKIIEQYDLDKNRVEKLINKLCKEDIARKIITKIFVYLVKAFREGKSASTLGYNLLELMEDLNVIDDFYECIEGRLGGNYGI